MNHRFIRWLWITLLFAPTGCATYTAAQMELVGQARKGVELAGEHLSALEQIAQQLHALRRLHWLQSVQLRWTGPTEEQPGKNPGLTEEQP